MARGARAWRGRPLQGRLRSAGRGWVLAGQCGEFPEPALSKTGASSPPPGTRARGRAHSRSTGWLGVRGLIGEPDSLRLGTRWPSERRVRAASPGPWQGHLHTGPRSTPLAARMTHDGGACGSPEQAPKLSTHVGN